MSYLAALSVGQGVYFLATGVWPLVSIRTFQKVTGPKTDLWLVKTVGILVAIIGLVLVLAGVRQRLFAEIAVLAIGSAAGLLAIDVWYSLKRVISYIYLLDAVIEVAIIGFWAIALNSAGSSE